MATDRELGATAWIVQSGNGQVDERLLEWLQPVEAISREELALRVSRNRSDRCRLVIICRELDNPTDTATAYALEHELSDHHNLSILQYGIPAGNPTQS